jgi:hypothetical protein
LAGDALAHAAKAAFVAGISLALDAAAGVVVATAIGLFPASFGNLVLRLVKDRAQPRDIGEFETEST